MTIDRFWELLSRKNCGEISSVEIKELEEILLAHPEWNLTAETLSNLNFQSTVFADNSEAELAFENHVNRMKKADVDFGDIELNSIEGGASKIITSKKWFIAFGILAGGTALFFGLRSMIVTPESYNKKKSTLSQVSTKPGSRTQIQLPDGSVVRLNSSSSLTYDKNFGKNIREVSLTGEAFFEVTKDSSHPFIIHTNVIDIKVVGTAFNVKSYPNETNTETSLIRGKVEVTVKNRSNEKIYLEPNEKLVVANDNPNSTIDKPTSSQPEQRNLISDLSSKPIYSVQHLTLNPVDSTVIETAWVDNRLIFQENETFKEVALKMERWYGVQMNFSSEKVAAYRPFASFKNETITQALDELKLGFKFNYKIEGNIIKITE